MQQHLSLFMNKERLQKALSQAGLGSRRQIEQWIRNGDIKINQAIAYLGDKISEKDTIAIKDKIISNPLMHTTKTRVLLYHKPIGEISSRFDPKHQKTVFDALPPIKYGRWIQVGRLDINTSGLLLFTNNGELANQLMHPKYSLEREYAVRVHGQVSDEMVQALLRGVELEDGKARFKKITYQGGEGANSWYHVVLTEGRNREVRRLWASQGVEVSRLIRIRFGGVKMPRFLKRGDYIELTPAEMKLNQF